jgi:hypothetical protein
MKLKYLILTSLLIIALSDQHDCIQDEVHTFPILIEEHGRYKDFKLPITKKLEQIDDDTVAGKFILTNKSIIIFINGQKPIYDYFLQADVIDAEGFSVLEFKSLIQDITRRLWVDLLPECEKNLKVLAKSNAYDISTSKSVNVKSTSRFSKWKPWYFEKQFLQTKNGRLVKIKTVKQSSQQHSEFELSDYLPDKIYSRKLDMASFDANKIFYTCREGVINIPPIDINEAIIYDLSWPVLYKDDNNAYLRDKNQVYAVVHVKYNIENAELEVAVVSNDILVIKEYDYTKKNADTCKRFLRDFIKYEPTFSCKYKKLNFNEVVNVNSQPRLSLFSVWEEDFNGMDLKSIHYGTENGQHFITLCGSYDEQGYCIPREFTYADVELCWVNVERKLESSKQCDIFVEMGGIYTFDTYDDLFETITGNLESNGGTVTYTQANFPDVIFTNTEDFSYTIIGNSLEIKKSAIQVLKVNLKISHSPCGGIFDTLLREYTPAASCDSNDFNAYRIKHGNKSYYPVSGVSLSFEKEAEQLLINNSTELNIPTGSITDNMESYYAKGDQITVQLNNVEIYFKSNPECPQLLKYYL